MPTIPKKTKQITKQSTPINPNPPISTKTDKRFESLAYDPKFKKPNLNIAKVKIDPKFATPLKSDKFKIQGNIDKYGRNIYQNNINNMSDYYYQEHQLQQNYNNQLNNHQLTKNNKNKQTNIKPKQQKNKKQTTTANNSQNQQQQQQNPISKWMQQYNQQSSDATSQQYQNDQIQDTDSLWSDNSSNIIKGQQVTITKRLALCNYDWMNITAKDLMILFSSFKPTEGTILSVSVYYSQFGKQRLEMEQMHGPQGIWKVKQQQNQQQSKSNQKKKIQASNKQLQTQAFNQKKLRAYQKQRIKYCYAVIECNSTKTSNQLYKQCDGTQFQNSTLLFDLRYIPDNIHFDPSMLKQQCNQLPIIGSIKNFINKSLGHTHLQLTWENPLFNPISYLKNKNWNTITQDQLDHIDWDNYINQDNFIKYDRQDQTDRKKQISSKNLNTRQNNMEANVSDWRKQCNKAYKKKHQQQQLSITFPSGFSTKQQPSLKLQQPSLKKQLRSRKQRRQQIKRQKKQKQQIQLLLQTENKQQFIYNSQDNRFNAIFNNPLYSIDPSSNKFDHRTSGQAFLQVVKRNKNKNLL